MNYRINPFLDFSTKSENQMRWCDPVSQNNNYNNIFPKRKVRLRSPKPFFRAPASLRSQNPFASLGRR